MKKFLFLVVLFFVTSSVSQNPVKNDSATIKKEAVVDKKIDSIIQKNQEDAKIIKAVSEVNKEKLKRIKEIDERQELLVDRLLTYFKKNKHKKPEVKKQVYTSVKKVSETILVNSRYDSICVQTSRTFLGKKKCIQWEKINN